MSRNFFFIFLIPFTSVCQNQMVSKADGTAMLSTRYEKAVLDYMKTNGMKSISDENELTAIVKYYNSIAH